MISLHSSLQLSSLSASSCNPGTKLELFCNKCTASLKFCITGTPIGERAATACDIPAFISSELASCFCSISSSSSSPATSFACCSFSSWKALNSISASLLAIISLRCDNSFSHFIQAECTCEYSLSKSAVPAK